MMKQVPIFLILVSFVFSHSQGAHAIAPATQSQGEDNDKIAVGSQNSNEDKVIAWIQEDSTPLVSDQKNYGQLEQQFESAKVIGLGEATHGQHEVFELKRQLTMHLIREHGFRVVAYEANMSSAVACNDFISGKTADRNKAVAGLGMLIWQVEENAKLLDDLKAWNQHAKPQDQVRFIGVDAQDGKAAIKRLESLLGDNNLKSVEQLKTLHSRLDGAMRQAMQGDTSSLTKLLNDTTSTCETIEKLAAEQSLDLSQIELGLKEFMANLAMYSQPGMRDKQMADLLITQLALDQNQNKCVFWGHNGHVQRSELWLGGKMVPAMGAYLAKSLVDKYYSVGFVFGKGEFQANIKDENNAWRFRRYRHSAAPAGSMGAMFAKAKSVDFILDFRTASKDKDVQTWLNSEHSFRSWGGHNVPEGFDDPKTNPLPRCVPAQTYDGIAFHYQTTAANPLSPKLVIEEQVAENQPQQPESIAKQRLRIGDKAPTLDVAHWLKQPNNKITEFEPGRIYVIDFWGTWCGNCIREMPELARLQKQFADQNVTFISVTDEEPEDVNAFLDKDSHHDETMTYRELTAAIRYAVDPDGSVFDDYMKGIERRSFPMMAIVGRTGLIEYNGSTSGLADWLPSIVNGDWDREAARISQLANWKAQETYVKINELRQEGKIDEAIEVFNDKFDKANLAMRAASYRLLAAKLSKERPNKETLAEIEAEFQHATTECQRWERNRFGFLCTHRSTEAVEHLHQLAAAYESSALERINLAWLVYIDKDMGFDIDQTLILAARDVAKAVCDENPNNSTCLDVLAHLQHAAGEFESARKTFQQAIGNANDETRAEIQKSFDDLFKEDKN